MRLDGKHLRRLVAAGTAAAALLVVGPAVANASTVSTQNGKITYSAAPGEQNATAIKENNGKVTFSDPGATIKSGAGCKPGTTVHQASCADAGVTAIQANLADQNDSLSAADSVQVGITGQGGAGDDVLRGGPKTDTLVGAEGDDRLDGRGGADDLRGGDGEDIVDYSTRLGNLHVSLDGLPDDGGGSEGDDVDSTVEDVLGGAGNDTLVGDGAANKLTGGGGDDTLEGLNGADLLDGGSGVNTVTYQERTASVNVSLDGVANDGAAGENDQVAHVQNILGGAGADTLTGNGSPNVLEGRGGSDTVTALAGDDIVRGSPGTDHVDLGSGDDTYAWKGGNGSAVIEGKDDNDTLTVDGSDTDEHFFLTRNGGRLKLTRDIGSITLDVDDVENVGVKAFGGTDGFTVDDLTGTDVKATRLDLSAANGGGDGRNEIIDVVGTTGDDTLNTTVANGETALTGLSASVTIAGADKTDNVRLNLLAGNDHTGADPSLIGFSISSGPGSDTVTAHGTENADAFKVTADFPGFLVDRDGRMISADAENLVVDARGGDDTVDANSNLPSVGTSLTVDAGTGNDTIAGSLGSDTVFGGDGNDTVDAGAGDDTVTWNPGDDNDTVEGQDGTDTLQFNGANISEKFDFAANGSRLRLTRDVANVVMDVNDVELMDLRTLGGADQVVQHDLSGTDLTELNVDLAGPPNAGDGAPDSIIVEGTGGDDVAQVVGDASGVSVLGLAARVNITHAEAANDRLNVNTFAGDDVIEGSGLTADSIQFTGDGGDDNDIVIGGAGNDHLIGGNGDDVLIGNAGQDILDAAPGNDVTIPD